jgi:hypothetical protein
MLFTDPSGHSSCVGAHADDGPDCAKKEWSDVSKHIEQKKYQDKCARGENDCLGPKPDARYAFLTIAAGGGRWYGAWSFDMVVTNHEVGYFAVSSLGPAAPLDGDKYFPSFRGLSDYEATFMTPQIGASLFGGSVWGKDLRPENGGVQNYSGPALVLGGSGSLFGAEHVASINRKRAA